MNSEEILDTVHNTAEKATNLIPLPRTRVGDTLPQTFQQIAADLCHIAEVAAECVNNALDDLRYCLDNLNNNGRQICYQRNEQLNSRLNKLRNCSYHRVNNARNND